MSTHTVDRTPAAPAGKPKMTPKSMAIWGTVALVGAVCWSVLALSRGENVSALWVLFAALAKEPDPAGPHVMGCRSQLHAVAGLLDSVA